VTPPEISDVVLSVVRRTGGLETLLYLDVVGESSKREICRVLEPSPVTIGRTLDAFAAWGLVRSTPLDRFPFSHIYSLTSIGQTLVNAPLRAWPELIRKAGLRDPGPVLTTLAISRGSPPRPRPKYPTIHVTRRI
jgi:DNA-binding HxlR family transcriptional regulator